ELRPGEAPRLQVLEHRPVHLVQHRPHPRRVRAPPERLLAHLRVHPQEEDQQLLRDQVPDRHRAHPRRTIARRRVPLQEIREALPHEPREAVTQLPGTHGSCRRGALGHRSPPRKGLPVVPPLCSRAPVIAGPTRAAAPRPPSPEAPRPATAASSPAPPWPSRANAATATPCPSPHSPA